MSMSSATINGLNQEKICHQWTWLISSFFIRIKVFLCYKPVNHYKAKFK